jgi:hypothetical protein
MGDHHHRFKPLLSLVSGIVDALGDRRVLSLLSLTFTLIAIASGVYMWLEGWGPVDAVYFSVATIATVGYGDLTPVTTVGKIFTIFYIVCGIGLFVAAVTALAEHLVRRAGQDDRD